MEGTDKEIVIVGAGIAGLTIALGLHRLGIRSLVLESSETLRTSGFAISTWQNAWRALDVVGVGDCLRQNHNLILGVKTFSSVSGLPTTERRLDDNGAQYYETRCVQRNRLLETLASELPSGTIRYSSKLVSIEQSGPYSKLIHLSDGSFIKAKVLIGADGVNSLVAKWLGFKPPTFTSRAAIRGTTVYERGHGFEPIFMQFFGDGTRFGVIPCDDNTVYWFFTWSPSKKDMEIERDQRKLHPFVLTKLGKVSDQVRSVFEDTNPDTIIISPLRFRHPWELLWGNISKANVCVAGDAFHPMTPDIGQGGCSALEDGVVLARCLGQALSEKNGGDSEEEESRRIELGLQKYARERRWRGFELVSTAYLVGWIQQSSGKLLGFLRDKVLAGFLAGKLLKMATFDCGKLS